jgi:hypothetical protein
MQGNDFRLIFGVKVKEEQCPWFSFDGGWSEDPEEWWDDQDDSEPPFCTEDICEYDDDVFICAPGPVVYENEATLSEVVGKSTVPPDVEARYISFLTQYFPDSGKPVWLLIPHNDI